MKKQLSTLNYQLSIILLSLGVWFGAEAQFTIQADKTSICQGEQVTFTMQNPPTNFVFPGNTCNSQGIFTQVNWKVGSNIVSNSQLFTTNSLNNGEVVTCEMYQYKTCLSGNTTYVAFSNTIVSNNSITMNVKKGDVFVPNGYFGLTNYVYTHTITNNPEMNYKWTITPNLGTIVQPDNTNTITINTADQVGQGFIQVETQPKACTSYVASKTLNDKYFSLSLINMLPLAPTNLVGSETSPFTLSWTAGFHPINVPITNYEIYYSSLPEIPETAILTPTNNTSYVFNNLLQDSRTYSFAIATIDSRGKRSNRTNAISVYIDFTPPNPPSKPEIISRSKTKTTLSWNDGGDNVGTTGYDLYINGVKFKSDIPSTQYTITNPTPRPVPFEIKVKAKDLRGNESVFSDTTNIPRVQPINIDETTGYVGIGVVPPTERLHVAGNLKIEDGTLIFKGTPPMATHIKAEVGDVKIGSNVSFNSLGTNLPNRITYNGSALEFYTPVQGQWNGQKPVFSLSQYGEIEFYSSPVLNYNTLMLKGKGGYNNGLRYGEDFAGTTGFKGPMLYGENGGILGTNTTNTNNTGTNVALKWDGTGKVGIGVAGALTEKFHVNGNMSITGSIKFADGSIQTKAPVNMPIVNNYLTYSGDMNITGKFKIGTGSLYLGGVSGGIPGTKNEIYSTGGALEIQSKFNYNSSQNTIINKLGGKVGIGGFEDSELTEKLEVSGNVKIHWDNVLELGGSLEKEINAGKIGYGTFDPSALCIVGAGGTALTRKIHFWNEGGAVFEGNMEIGNSLGIVTKNPIGAQGAKLHLADYDQSTVNPSEKTWSIENYNHFLYFKRNGIAKFVIDPNGQIGIGNNICTAYNPNATNFHLSVDGMARFKRVRVDAGAWCDYVFESDYKLTPLNELEKYIIKNKHLPEIPSKAEAQKYGVFVDEMQEKLLKKVEELTLYIIQLKKEINTLK